MVVNAPRQVNMTLMMDAAKFLTPLIENQESKLGRDFP